MNKLIVLAAITMVLYGKAHCNCDDTYDIQNNKAIKRLYDDSIPGNEQFLDASKSIISVIQDILKDKTHKEFKFDSQLIAEVR